ncbi:MAG TPA: hypothetical protein VKC89_00110 [Patescibacteria group bacterium]|nr:hypothetical protein [Patescibacteria group bacterium]
MAEVIHEHEHSDGGNSMGFVMGVILLIVALFLFAYYLLPAIRNSGGTSFNVPGKIDVNVNQPK